MTPISYDSNLRSFTVHLPDGGSFQAASWRAAEQAYLLAVAPALGQKVTRLAQAHPELASRARRSARLILAGAVTPALPGEMMTSNGRYHRTAPVLARVKSQDSGVEYVVTRNESGQVICNCPDGSPMEGEAGAPRSRLASHTCKHILATVLSSWPVTETGREEDLA